MLGLEGLVGGLCGAPMMVSLRIIGSHIGVGIGATASSLESEGNLGSQDAFRLYLELSCV